jgi:hypothetical protein
MLIANELEGEANQDWREDRQPRSLCHLPDGGGRHSQNFVRRHSAADRGTAATTRYIHAVRRAVVMRSLQLTGGVRLEES